MVAVNRKAVQALTAIDVQQYCGWIPAPAITEKWLEADAQRKYADPVSALKELRDKWKDRPDVALWEFEKQVLGKIIPTGRQGIGDGGS